MVFCVYLKLGHPNRQLQLTRKFSCKIFTQTKLTDVLYRFLLYFPNFREDILSNKKVTLHEFLQEFGHVIWSIHGLKSEKMSMFRFFKFQMHVKMKL